MHFLCQPDPPEMAPTFTFCPEVVWSQRYPQLGSAGEVYLAIQSSSRFKNSRIQGQISFSDQTVISFIVRIPGASMKFSGQNRLLM
jgi:hypothetical protein